MNNPLFDSMKQSILDGDPDAAMELARQALAQQLDPLEAINQGYLPGMSQVGQQFGTGELFLPDVILAAEAMKKATAILEPEMEAHGTQRQAAGKVVIGTVKGDVHEIGKSLVATLLSANGFEVYDLGVDVPFERFAAKAGEVDADIVGVSALLTTTMTGQKQVIAALDNAGLRPKVKVMVGGAPVTRTWAQEIGADGYSEDALGAVEVAKKLVEAGH
ncbi:MAG TPA: corrinoid protein [Longilinea sp.]|nr:corrinoid protein [Longilinea sp.]